MTGKQYILSSFVLSACIFFWGSCCTNVFAGMDRPYRLAIVAVTNETGENVFSELLIVQGMASLLTQDFYDSGLFVPVEENPEIKSRIKGMLAAYSSTLPDLNTLVSQVQDMGCDALASAAITEMNKSRLSGFAGIFSGARTTITIKTRVQLRMPDGRIYSGTGEGQGVTKAVGAFFQIRHDKIAFDKTTVGRAVKEAIGHAVDSIVEQLR